MDGPVFSIYLYVCRVYYCTRVIIPKRAKATRSNLTHLPFALDDPECVVEGLAVLGFTDRRSVRA